MRTALAKEEGAWGSSSCGIHNHKVERNEFWYPADFFAFIFPFCFQSRIPGHGMMPPILRVVLQSSVKLTSEIASYYIHQSKGHIAKPSWQKGSQDSVEWHLRYNLCVINCTIMINSLPTCLSSPRLWVCLFTVGLFFDRDQHGIVKTHAVVTIPKASHVRFHTKQKITHTQIDTKAMSNLPTCRQTRNFELTKFTADQKFVHFYIAIIIPSLLSMGQWCLNPSFEKLQYFYL